MNDLDLEYAHRELRIIIRSVPDTIHVVVLTYFNLVQLQCATKPDTPNRLPPNRGTGGFTSRHVTPQAARLATLPLRT